MRESDIRPASLLAEYLRLSALDAEHFFGDKSALTHRCCPGCGVNFPTPEFDKNGFTLVRCKACRTLYVTPCPTSEQLASFYIDSPSTQYWSTVFFPSVAEARRERIFKPRAKRVKDILETLNIRAERICEVGAGAGIFLEEMQAVMPTAELCAIEPGLELAKICREKGFATFEGFAEQAANDSAWNGKHDLIVSFEVVEHIPDTQVFISALTRLAKPRGLILLSGLCGDGFDIRLLGEKSNAVSPPHHLTFLSRRGAVDVLSRCGLYDPKVITPGELDVDIVRNAIQADPTAVADSYLREVIIDADDATRSALQAFVRDNGLSSHMWMFAQKNA